MKKYAYLLVMALLVGFAACTKQEPQSDSIRIVGSAQDVGELYLYDVVDEHYKFIRQLDTIPVGEDGTIEYENDSIGASIYFIAPASREKIQEALERGKIVFLTKGVNKLTWTSDDKAILKDNPVDEEYQAFILKKDELADQSQLDSLYALFYEARDRGDKEEMARLNNEVIPEQEEAGRTRVIEWRNGLLKEQRTDLFGIYLYYTYSFMRTPIRTYEDISNFREALKRFDDDAKASAYYSKMQDTLEKAEKTVIGATAPDIWGETPDGDTVHLTDFRGNYYVLIDFWASHCGWCRAETPELLKAYNEYKDKGFTILGVSSDFKRDDWLKAIDEDGAVWEHILMSDEVRQKTFDAYNITGIPQIYLIDKEGKILARDLRGEDILDAVAEHVK